jgi:hypothetical protein
VDADVLLDSRNLVFDVQFAPFEFDQFQIIGRWMGQGFVDFSL